MNPARSAETWVVLDLGFGDAGKGTVTDFLVRDRDARLVVRWNGGAQAGHTVVTADGRRHTFAQLGAGSFVPGVRTHLGPGFVLHPLGLWIEARRLGEVGVPDVLARTTIDRRAIVITPFQQAAGKLRELLRGDARHGTCGVGVGEAVRDALAGGDDTLRAADLDDAQALSHRLRSQQERKREELAAARNLSDFTATLEWGLLDDPGAADRILELWGPVARAVRIVGAGDAQALLAQAGHVVFEGAQGVLLDETWGFHPHTTWSDCTAAGALDMLRERAARPVRLGVVRAYATRHGEGPFPTHDPAYDAALPEPHNHDAGWQGAFRRGPLDLVLLAYALQVAGGADGLALTCLDRVAGRKLSLCTGYELEGAPAGLVETDRHGRIVRLRPGPAADLAHRTRLGELLRRVRPVLEPVAPRRLARRLEEALGVPVLLKSAGPAAADKTWRRTPGG